MYRAVVVNVDDPERRGRIRVQCPAVLGEYLSAWCEPCIPYATDFAGDYYVPPVGEGIWVQFEGGDANKPIWNGGWYKENSSPLTSKASPEDYRYISFKDSVLRMGQCEFIFELREGTESHTVTINPDTWIGINYVSGFDEQKILDLETLIINKDWLLSTRPEEEQEEFEELQTLVTGLLNSYNDFTQITFPTIIEEIYIQIQQVYNASHSELESVVSQLSGVSSSVGNVKNDLSAVMRELTKIKEVMNSNTEKANEIFATINDLKVSGKKVFPDEFPELELIP